jgi:hypothetical protein
LVIAFAAPRSWKCAHSSDRQPVPNLCLEAIEDEAGEHRVKVFRIEEVLGTRYPAEQARISFRNYPSEGAPHYCDATSATESISKTADY